MSTIYTAAPRTLNDLQKNFIFQTPLQKDRTLNILKEQRLHCQYMRFWFQAPLPSIEFNYSVFLNAEWHTTILFDTWIIEKICIADM